MAEEVGANGAIWSGWKAARDTLRQWREESCRKSDRVVDLGRRLLDGYASKLGDEGRCASSRISAHNIYWGRIYI